MDKTKDVQGTQVLTRQKLWDGIVAYLNSDEKNSHSKTDDRYRGNISEVLNDLYHPINWNYNPKDKTPEGTQRERQIDNYVKSKSELMTFTYYLQSCPQFSFLWSYLTKKIDSFKDFIGMYEAFIDKFISDLNSLYQNVKCRKLDLRYCVNDFLTISFNQDYTISVEMDFEKLSAKLQKCSAKCYDLTVLLNKTTLGVYTIREKEDMQQIAARLETLIISGNHANG
ncbi:MAG: hypothetical protein NC453_13515 [Muribaculum sp.]|nr:hypothetical protein [Muribaculum sp.]